MLTPELDKLKSIADDSHKQGEFLDWLLNVKNYSLSSYDKTSKSWRPCFVSIENLLAEFHGIDLQKCELERRELLKSIRN